MPFTPHYGDADSSALGCCQGRAERAAAAGRAGGRCPGVSGPSGSSPCDMELARAAATGAEPAVTNR